MSFPVVVVILLLITAGAVVFFRLTKHPEPVKPAPEKRLSSLEKRKQTNIAELNKIRHSNQYWGACIQPDKRAECCDAAKSLKGQEFSIDDIPNLPLTACNKHLCLCNYVGLEEKRRDHRRHGSDRREEVRFDADGSDRRSGKDRRKGSYDIWFHHDIDG